MDNSIAIRDETGLVNQDDKQFSSAIAVSPEYVAKTKQSLALLSSLVNDLLVEGRDYGSIPNVPDDFLWDPGSSLIVSGFNCRFGPVRVLKETFTEAMIAVVLEMPILSLQNGQEVACCVGAASTTEIKNKYRWIYENDLPEWGYTDPAVIKTLKTKKDKVGHPYQWRIPNPEPAELLNNIWKMAAKRGRVGATKLLPGVASTLAAKFHKEPKGNKKREPTSDWDIFWSDMTKRGLKQDDVHKMLKVKSMKDYVASGKTLEQAVNDIDNLLALLEDAASESDDNLESLETVNAANHFCDKHATPFFMRGSMKAFAHPITDKTV